MPTPFALLAIGALLFATLAWSSLFFIGKSLLGVLDPIWFTTLRYTLATVGLLALVQLFGHTPWRKLVQHGRRLTGFGLAGYGAFSLLVFIGLAHSLPSHGAVIMATIPLSALLVRWVLDGIRPSARALTAAFVALTGVALVAGLFGSVGGKGAADAAAVLLGDLLTLSGTLGWVFYTRGASSLPELSALEYTALTAVASLPWLLLFAVAASLAHLATPPSLAALGPAWPKLLYIAAVPTVAAALAFNFGVRRLGAPSGTLFLNFVPVSALAISAMLGSWPRPHELSGALLVGAALWLNASSAKPSAG